jgi:hypothetical protein
MRIEENVANGMIGEEARRSALLALGLAGLAGAFLPAWRASRADPLNALRYKQLAFGSGSNYLLMKEENSGFPVWIGFIIDIIQAIDVYP